MKETCYMCQYRQDRATVNKSWSSFLNTLLLQCLGYIIQTQKFAVLFYLYFYSSFFFYTFTIFTYNILHLQTLDLVHNFTVSHIYILYKYT